jgi:inositol oxygenase
MSIWDAMVMLDTLVDESDPDTDVSQLEHLLQTAEAMRRDGKLSGTISGGCTSELVSIARRFGIALY